MISWAKSFNLIFWHVCKLLWGGGFGQCCFFRVGHGSVEVVGIGRYRWGFERKLKWGCRERRWNRQTFIWFIFEGEGCLIVEVFSSLFAPYLQLGKEMTEQLFRNHAKSLYDVKRTRLQRLWWKKRKQGNKETSLKGERSFCSPKRTEILSLT